MGQEEGPLVPTEIESSSKYESESESNTRSTLLSHNFSPSISLPSLLPLLYTIS